MFRTLTIVTLFMVILVAVLLSTFLSKSGDVPGAGAPDGGQVVVVPRIVLDSRADSQPDTRTEPKRTPAMSGEIAGDENEPMRFALNRDMEFILEIVNSGDSTVYVYVRRPFLDFFLMREGRMQGRDLTVMYSLRPEAVQAIEPSKEFEVKLRLNSATSEPITPGRYELLMHLDQPAQTIVDPFKLTRLILRKRVDVIVTAN